MKPLVAPIIRHSPCCTHQGFDREEKENTENKTGGDREKEEIIGITRRRRGHDREEEDITEMKRR